MASSISSFVLLRGISDLSSFVSNLGLTAMMTYGISPVAQVLVSCEPLL